MSSSLSLTIKSGKYLRVLKAIARSSWKIEAEYRINFILRIVTDIFWYVSQIFLFEVLYQHVPRIGPWEIQHIRVFLGILFVVDALYMILFHENLDRFSDRVRKGELDLLLTKPVDAQIFVSLQKISWALIGNLSIATAFLIWALLPWWSSLNGLRLFAGLLLIPGGVLSIYAVRFMMAILALIVVRAENIQYIWYQIYRLGLRPDHIYHPGIRLLIVTILPVGLVASIPTRILFDASPGWWLALALTVPFILNLAARWLWKKALTRYSSASS
jgi:ABC-2 type transport system permease protein